MCTNSFNKCYFCYKCPYVLCILSILHSAIVAYELIRHHEYDMIIVPSYIPFYMHFNIILVAYLKTWEIDQFGCNC